MLTFIQVSFLFSFMFRVRVRVIIGFSGVGRILVWGAASRRRGGEAPKPPRGVGCGEGCPPPRRGRGLCPLPRKFLII